MSATAVSKITSKGQVTIPESVRRAMDLQPGDHLEWHAGDDGVVRLRRVAHELEHLVGFLGTPSRSATVEEMREAIRRRVAEDAPAER